MAERVDTPTGESALAAEFRTGDRTRAAALAGERLTAAAGAAGPPGTGDPGAAADLAAWVGTLVAGVAPAAPPPGALEGVLSEHARSREVCFQMLHDVVAGGDPREIQKSLGYPVRDTFYAHLRRCRDGLVAALAPLGSAAPAPSASRCAGGSDQADQLAAWELGILPERLRQEAAAHLLLCDPCFGDAVRGAAIVAALRSMPPAQMASLRPAPPPEEKPSFWQRFFKSSYYGKD